MAEPWAYVNGLWVPQSQAGLALNDAGFVMGVTVTDLVRTFRQQLYRWHDHLARFRQGTRALHLHIPSSDAELSEIAQEAVRRNSPLLKPDQELCLVLFATPGRIGYYAGQPGSLHGPLTFGLHTFPLPFDRYRDWTENGVVLRVPTVPHLPSACVPRTIKHRSRLHWWRADHEVVAQDPAAKSLLLDEDGNVTETAAANFLVVHEGRVLSPERTRVLPGVSLQVVSELCAAEKIPFEERALPLEFCLDADEAMVCGSAFCLAGVRQLDDRTYPFPGPVLQRLVNRWSQTVGVDIYRQVRENSTIRLPSRENRPVAPTGGSEPPKPPESVRVDDVTEPGATPVVTPQTPRSTRPSRGTPAEFHKVLGAVSFAARAHRGQTRKDGETPYVSHVMRVCLIVAQRFGIEDPTVLQAALLHDVIEDTTHDFDDLAAAFSPVVARWAALLCKDKRLPDETREDAYLKVLRKAPWQVQVGKLADVYDNLLDNAALDAERRDRSRNRARKYLDGLSGAAHPEVQRCWRIVDSLYRQHSSAVGAT